MRKVLATLLATSVFLGMSGGVSKAKTPTNKRPNYTAQVIAGTISYGPCRDMRQTKFGRIAYRDMVSDNTDDGRKRSVKAQISYVKQGCRNGV